MTLDFCLFLVVKHYGQLRNDKKHPEGSEEIFFQALDGGQYIP